MPIKEKVYPLVLGAATGYHPEKVLVFLNSFHQAQFIGKVVLFINDSQYDEYLEFYQHKDYSFELEFIKTKIGIFHSSKRMGKNYKKFVRFMSQLAVIKTRHMRRS